MKRTFASTLAELRRSSGRSQRQVANDLKISQALLSHYENGASNHTHLEGASADAARSILKQFRQLADKAEELLEDIE